MKLLKAKLLETAFNYLNAQGVHYCVMSKYNELPNVIIGDIDIAIGEKDYSRLDELVAQIAISENVLVVQKVWHGYKKCAYLLSPRKISKKFYFQLDFFIDFSVNGLPNLMPGDIMLAGRRQYNGFMVPELGVEMLFLIMRRIAKNDWNLSHLERIKEISAQLSEKGQQDILNIFGEEAGILLLDSIESADMDKLYDNESILLTSLKRISSKNTSIRYRAAYLVHQFSRIVNRLRYPVGMSIAFLGPDGSGKSAISEKVQELVSGIFFGVESLYWRPSLLPLMGEIGRKPNNNNKKVNTEPHGHAKNGTVKSLVRFLYYVIDYIVGFFPKIYWPVVRKKIVIIDRYYCDYLVDLHRYRFNLPIWFPKILFPLIPQPDILVYLDVEPEEIEKRKQELLNNELKRQVSEFRKLKLKIPNFYVVDNNGPMDQAIQEIGFIILQYKEQSTKKTLKLTNIKTWI